MADADLEDLLFAYAAGSLDAAARSRMEAALDADPELRRRLRWYESVCDGLVARLPPAPSLPAPDVIVAAARAARRNAPQGFFAWLAGPALRPAAALAALLIVAQAAIITGLVGERGGEEPVRALAPDQAAVVFVVAFDPQATEADIRALLLKAGGTIIDGPRQLGDYRVSVPANRADYAKSLFEESGIAEYVRAEEATK
jgi:anti-sigma-K factor RskA